MTLLYMYTDDSLFYTITQFCKSNRFAYNCENIKSYMTNSLSLHLSKKLKRHFRIHKMSFSCTFLHEYQFLMFIWKSRVPVFIYTNTPIKAATMCVHVLV